MPALGRVCALLRGFSGDGVPAPRLEFRALLAALWAEIGPADFDAGKSGVSFVGSRRAHISPQCGLNGVFDMCHLRVFRVVYVSFCQLHTRFSSKQRSFEMCHFSLIRLIVRVSRIFSFTASICSILLL